MTPLRFNLSIEALEQNFITWFLIFSGDIVVSDSLHYCNSLFLAVSRIGDLICIIM